MLSTWKNNDNSRASTLVTSFTPRQVLLSSLSSSIPNMKKTAITTKASLSPESRVLLLQSICQFLHSNGFQKSLNKFLKEADVKKDSWKDCFLNLEEMCHEYLQIKESDTKQKDEHDNHVSSVEAIEKAKDNGAVADDGKKSETGESVKKSKDKKKKNKHEGVAMVKESSDTADGMSQLQSKDVNAKKCPVENTLSMLSETQKKSKSKKKKHNDESEDMDLDILGKPPKVVSEESLAKANGLPQESKEETQSDECRTEDNLTVSDVSEKKSKDKKKKHKDNSEPLNKDSEEKPAEVAGDESADKTDDVSQEKKKSKDKKKKQKGESEPLEKVSSEKVAEVAGGKSEDKAVGVSLEKKKEKSKSKRKIDDSKSKKSAENDSCKKPTAEVNLHVSDGETVDDKKSSKKRKKSSSEDIENGHNEETPINDSKRRKTDSSDQSNEDKQPAKTPKSSANEFSEKDGEEKSEKQNKSKQSNGSAEPRTAANAFRRVKPDEVKFADERLQDNSYWAKDGADVGYGAKAQEVLGQVRGRDFRHEKTKKKRGSYRGGQIDLQSHSIKFNYDDEDDE